MKRLAAFCLLSCLAAVLFSGCISGRRAARIGALEKPWSGGGTGETVNCWPFFASNSQEEFATVMWPFFIHSKGYNALLWPLADWDDKGFAIRPFYVREESEHSLLWPLCGWGARRGWFANFIWDNGTYLFLPLAKYCGRRQFVPNYVGPLWWWPDRGFGLFPLFAYSCGGKYDRFLNLYRTEETCGFFPLARFSLTGGGDSFVLPFWYSSPANGLRMFLPFYYNSGTVHAGALWLYDASPESRKLMILNTYWSRTQNGNDYWSFFPLFGWGTGEDDFCYAGPYFRRSQALGVMPFFYRDRETDLTVVFPFYGARNGIHITPAGGWVSSPHGSSGMILNTYWARMDGRFSRLFILPFYLREPEMESFLPFYVRSLDNSMFLTLLGGTSPERDYAGPFYWKFRSEPGKEISRFGMFGVFGRSRTPGEKTDYVFPVELRRAKDFSGVTVLHEQIFCRTVRTKPAEYSEKISALGGMSGSEHVVAYGKDGTVKSRHDSLHTGLMPFARFKSDRSVREDGTRNESVKHWIFPLYYASHRTDTDRRRTHEHSEFFPYILGTWSDFSRDVPEKGVPQTFSNHVILFGLGGIYETRSGCPNTNRPLPDRSGLAKYVREKRTPKYLGRDYFSVAFWPLAWTRESGSVGLRDGSSAEIRSSRNYLLYHFYSAGDFTNDEILNGVVYRHLRLPDEESRSVLGFFYRSREKGGVRTRSFFPFITMKDDAPGKYSEFSFCGPFFRIADNRGSRSGSIFFVKF